MVRVCMRVEQHFDVADAESQLRNARDDQWRGLGITTVDEDVSRGTGEEERRDPRRADVVEIARDLKRFVRDRAVALDSGAPLVAEEHDDGGEGAEQDQQPSSFGEAGHAWGL